MQSFQQLDRLRRLPLPDILRACQGVPDRYDPHKWHTPAGVLSLTGLKFMNWTTGQGGGGAIDLVMHLRRLSFTQTVRWLNAHFPQFQTSVNSRSRGEKRRRLISGVNRRLAAIRLCQLLGWIESFISLRWASRSFMRRPLSSGKTGSWALMPSSTLSMMRRTWGG